MKHPLEYGNESRIRVEIKHPAAGLWQIFTPFKATSDALKR
jgi:hypothetical protein